LFNFEEPPKRFGATLSKLKNQVDLRTLETSDLVSKLKDAVIAPMEQILNYKFFDKNLLLHALTHRAFKESHNLNGHLEKLEVLGDAILDYIANSNLLQYTMFERYNIQERREQKFIMPEDFRPFDAH